MIEKEYSLRQKRFLNFIKKYDLNADEAWSEVVNNTYRFNYVNEYEEVINDYFFDGREVY